MHWHGPARIPVRSALVRAQRQLAVRGDGRLRPHRRSAHHPPACCKRTPGGLVRTPAPAAWTIAEDLGS
jgi:hypothetical protein